MNKIVVKKDDPNTDGFTSEYVEIDLDTLSIDAVGPYFLYNYKGGSMTHRLGYYDLKYWLHHENNQKCKIGRAHVSTPARRSSDLIN